MVCVYKHLYCSTQLSMSNTDKRYRNKIIIIIKDDDDDCDHFMKKEMLMTILLLLLMFMLAKTGKVSYEQKLYNSVS